jgi:hypothetical protein
MNDDDGGFAPPPFAADAALTQLRRALRDLQLAERGSGYELRGKRVVELELDAAARAIQARIARKPALTPEWDRQLLKTPADQRRLLDEVKKRLARWERDE